MDRFVVLKNHYVCVIAFEHLVEDYYNSSLEDSYNMVVAMELEVWDTRITGMRPFLVVESSGLSDCLLLCAHINMTQSFNLVLIIMKIHF